jgi:hypothetical protein
VHLHRLGPTFRPWARAWSPCSAATEVTSGNGVFDYCSTACPLMTSKLAVPFVLPSTGASTAAPTPRTKIGRRLTSSRCGWLVTLPESTGAAPLRVGQLLRRAERRPHRRGGTPCVDDEAAVLNTQPVYAVDLSVWPCCDPEASPERGSYYHPSRHSAGQPIALANDGVFQSSR